MRLWHCWYIFSSNTMLNIFGWFADCSKPMHSVSRPRIYNKNCPSSHMTLSKKPVNSLSSCVCLMSPQFCFTWALLFGRNFYINSSLALIAVAGRKRWTSWIYCDGAGSVGCHLLQTTKLEMLLNGTLNLHSRNHLAFIIKILKH